MRKQIMNGELGRLSERYGFGMGLMLVGAGTLWGTGGFSMRVID